MTLQSQEAVLAPGEAWSHCTLCSSASHNVKSPIVWTTSQLPTLLGFRLTIVSKQKERVSSCQKSEQKPKDLPCLTSLGQVHSWPTSVARKMFMQCVSRHGPPLGKGCSQPSHNPRFPRWRLGWRTEEVLGSSDQLLTRCALACWAGVSWTSAFPLNLASPSAQL